MNAEFDNILNSALSLISPLTGALDAGGNDVTNLDELEFNDGAADPTTTTRLRLSGSTLQWRIEDARTNTTTRPFAILATTTGTPAASIGVGMRFDAESGDEAPSQFGALDFVATDVTAASEDTELRILTRAAGAALAEVARISSTAASFGTTSTTAQMNVLSGAAGRVGLIVNTAASPTTQIQEWQINGTLAAFVQLTNTVSRISLDVRDLGNNVAGPFMSIQRNSSAGTEGPAAGTLSLIQADGGGAYLWHDNSADPGILRMHTAPPTGSSGTPTVSDTAGTVVGTQTSWWKLKENIIPFADHQKALAAILETPLYSFDMNSRHYDAGYVIHDEDKSKWFSWNDQRQQIPALNERQIFGYLAASIKVLNKRLEILEAN